jgi:hypothetical protein
MADHISTLVEVYNRWLENNDIKERGSADEILFGYEPLTDYQRAWLRRFIDVWEVAQDHEYELKLNKAYKKERP